MIFTPEFSPSTSPLQEYPRPQFRRNSYLSLNGSWEYAITQTSAPPARYDGHILVPYSPESPCSGVGRQLAPGEYLHYRTYFTLPQGFLRGRLLLNTGACDQVCSVFLNGVCVGTHQGGYLPFSLELTGALRDGANELRFTVQDDASSHIYGRGKQHYRAKGIWYTAISGIWQSVWLESVPAVYLHTLTLRPALDEQKLYVSCCTAGGACRIAYEIYDGDVLLDRTVAASGERACLNASACKAWSPDSPELYRLILTAGEDRVESYFGMRSFSRIQRGGTHYFALNGEPCFQSGLLDQGYWGDGIYTPHTNQEMYECLKRVKSLGFHMLRKHIKLEPLLWYYYCDILGILVWQDMVNGGAPYSLFRMALCPFFDLHLNDRDHEKMGRGDPLSRAQFISEAEESIRLLSPCVCICLYTIFNEAWGQFDSIEIWKRLRAIDDSRLYDHASGWQDMGGGDLCSRHIYFRGIRLKNDGKRILALTECGGYAYDVARKGRSFGYRCFRSKRAFSRALMALYRKQILPAVEKDGLCAVVYTQLCDVESEKNGIFTADWQLKTDAELLRSLHHELALAFASRLGKGC